MSHKYQLIDLGRPQEPTWAKAFIHCSKGDFLIKGGWQAVKNYFDREWNCPFFGKLVTINHDRKSTTVISGGGLLIKHYVHSRSREARRLHGREYYEFYDTKHKRTLKKVRRLPNRWIKDLKLDTDNQLLIAADYLEESNYDFGVAAEILRKAAADSDNDHEFEFKFASTCVLNSHYSQRY